MSKSEKKRRAKGIEQLVHELAMLSDIELADLPCRREIKDEILAAKVLKGGAQKRQLKYATKLLRDEPVEELFEFIARKKGSLLKKNREFHELEHFRNLLIDEAVQMYEEKVLNAGYIDENESVKFLFESNALDSITEYLPDVDRELLKKTAVQFARTRNRKYSRELFRILRAALEKKQFSQKQDKGDGI
ncbi:MAG: DUF615 domain-containing protein [Deltaproteobacteria bacterium]|nr:DUF615 domain-containing protein [Deltaproteobacteria bacterium]